MSHYEATSTVEMHWVAVSDGHGGSRLEAHWSEPPAHPASVIHAA